MPHEVIMPALGMAQETGQIVAWLKQPGDAVKAGEALMEVETDKATMEVEAATSGYLTDVRAGEGDSVPVGDVVALISDSAEPAGDAPPQSAASEAPKGQADPPVEGKQIIMPALGMAQDSGKIVSWSKSPGDRVASDDVLLEVETDKATMEVPAGHEGWLAETRAAEGEDVPVGEVIAIISTEMPTNPRSLGRDEVSSTASPSAAPVKAAEPLSEDVGVTPGTSPENPTPAPVTSKAQPLPAVGKEGGRVLASPKVRRLAVERGLDLGRLISAGHEPPFHVADLETLVSLPVERKAQAGATEAARIEAKVPSAALDAFCDWTVSEGRAVSLARAVATFATTALREVTRLDGRSHVGIARPGRPPTVHVDLDRLPLGQEAEAVEARPDFVLRDLTQSRLTGIAFGSTETATLTIGRSEDAFAMTLEFQLARLDPDAAIAFLEAVALRVDEPLRHLF